MPGLINITNIASPFTLGEDTQLDYIEEAVVWKLINAGSLQTLGVTAIYCDGIIPQGKALPAVAYTVISDKNDYTCDGRNDFATARIQFSIQANTAKLAKQVSTAIKVAFDSIVGNVAGVEVYSAILDNSGELQNFKAQKQQGRRFGRFLDYKFEYKEN